MYNTVEFGYVNLHKWRMVRGSNPQGLSARRFSRPVPSPAIGLPIRKVVDRDGFEPPRSRRRPVLQTGAFNQAQPPIQYRNKTYANVKKHKAALSFRWDGSRPVDSIVPSQLALSDRYELDNRNFIAGRIYSTPHYRATEIGQMIWQGYLFGMITLPVRPKIHKERRAAGALLY